MKNIKLFLLAVATVSMAASCERKNNDPEPVAGKGGTTTLSVTPKHHGKIINNCTVYIKYNTLDAATAYDDSVKCVPVNGIATASFTSLKKGKYYLYGVGYDTFIAQQVIGGAPYTIAQDGANLSYDLAVTEGD